MSMILRITGLYVITVIIMASAYILSVISEEPIYHEKNLYY